MGREKSRMTQEQGSKLRANTSPDPGLGPSRSARVIAWTIAHERLLLVTLVLLAGVLRIATLTRDSLWVDEGFTLATAALPFEQLWSVPFDTHPPLHFTIVKLFSVLPDGEWTVRLPSAIAGVLALFPLYALARRLFGPTGALASAAVWALSFTQLVYANNGRNYALLVCLLLAALYALHEVAARLKAGLTLRHTELLTWAIAYVLAGAGALYTHNIAIIYLFLINAVLCCHFLLFDPSRALFRTARLATINALMLVLWAPWLAVMFSTSGGFAWLQQADPISAARTYLVTLGPNGAPVLLVIAFFLAVAVGWAMVRPRLGWASLLIGTHLILFPALIWLIGWIYTPIYMERAILPVTVGAALAIGALAAVERPTWLTNGFLVLALFASVWSAGDYVWRDQQQKNLGGHLVQDWRGAVGERDGPGTGFILCTSFEVPVVDYYTEQSPLFVNEDAGLWAISQSEWLSFYGQSVSRRLARMRGPEAAKLTPWPEVAAANSTLVFLKPDIYCNDGEVDQIRERMGEVGFHAADARKYRGLTSESFVREP